MFNGEVPVSSPTLRFTAWVLILLFSSIVVGSWVGKTEIVARGKGRIVSSERTKTIQPQFGGQVLSLPVKDGDWVKTGDILLQLDPTEAKAEIEQFSAELDRQSRELFLSQSILTPLLTVDPARRQFTDTKDIDLDIAIIGDANPVEIEVLIQSTLGAIQAQVLEVDAEITQINSLVKTHASRIKQTETEFELVKERNQSAESLRKKGTITKTVYLDRLREIRAMETELAIKIDQGGELNARKKLAQQRRHRIISEAQARYRKAVAETRNTIDGIRANLQASKGRLRNTRLKAPVGGNIENLKIHTIGAHVTAGQEIMSVVPVNGRLEIEAFFQNQDAGFLQTSQKAFIKLDAFPAERFGVVNGTVRHVGTDARKIDEASGWVYAVQISLDQDRVQLANKTFSFASGMTGTVDVITGERRLISYFFEPIIKAIQDGFGER